MLRLIRSVFYLSAVLPTFAFATSGSCELTSGSSFHNQERVNWTIRRDYHPQPEVALATWGAGDRYSPLYFASLGDVEIYLQKKSEGISVSQATIDKKVGNSGGTLYPLTPGRHYVWSGQVKIEDQLRMVKIWCDVSN